MQVPLGRAQLDPFCSAQQPSLGFLHCLLVVMGTGIVHPHDWVTLMAVHLFWGRTAFGGHHLAGQYTSAAKKSGCLA